METYSVKVGTTAKRIVDYSPRRTVIMIYNNSSTTIYISTGSGVTVTNGFPLAGNQGMVIAREFGDDPTKAVWAIASNDNLDVRIWEGYGQTVGRSLEEMIEIFKQKVTL